MTRFRFPSWRTACAGAFAFLLWPLAAGAQDATRPPEPVQALVLDVQGRVEVRREGATNWEPVRAQQVIRPNDRVQTHENSLVALRVGNRLPVRFGELSHFTFLPPAAPQEPSRLNLWRGLLYFFGREKPARLRLDSPLCSTAIRGTEFVLEVQESGLTILTLVDGEAEVSAGALGSVRVKGGEQAVTEPGRKPFVTVGITAVNVLQWCLYYPAVLDLAELPLSAQEQSALSDSLAAYRAGDLRQALTSFPTNRSPASDSEKVYFAAILLAVGQVEKAEQQLAALAPTGGPPAVATVNARLAAALRQMIAAVKNHPWTPPRTPELATEWLAESYARQAQRSGPKFLESALQAARSAVGRSPGFAFGWVRVAELEFSFGRNAEAEAALEKALSLAPRNAQAVALQGFLLTGRNRIKEALTRFDQAIALDGRLANAWLGRGLCLIRQGRALEGRTDLLTAAAVEPQRAFLRSYLGKAFSDAGEDSQARHELDLARKLDPQDPTSWLYSALHLHQQNRVNEAIRDLEKSQELNDLRGLYRSGFLLDQDRAVRSANLARLYQDAGMGEVAFREAVRAVNADYGNYSAHLFLANSYQRFADPNGFNLRYETATSAEYLIANLLAPADAGLLSPTISQQEFSRLFQRDGLGLISSTEYLSRGAWTQSGAQYGQFGGTSYSLDGLYRADRGQRPNNDTEHRLLSLSLKQQLKAADSLFLQIQHYEGTGGDLAQRYDPRVYSSDYRFRETQEPNLTLGYHHEWAPGAHTLFLANYVSARLALTNTTQSTLLAFRPVDVWTGLSEFGIHEGLRIKPTIHSAELQQIVERPNWSTIVGTRFQYGRFDVGNFQDQPVDWASLFFDDFAPDAQQSYSLMFRRWSLYGYETWRVADRLQVIGGVTYDNMTYPRNFRDAPVSPEQAHVSSVSPKAGFIWTPAKGTTLRGAYSRSLAGPSLDQSLQLEPSQLAGFIQSYRSLISESVLGAKAGARFETFGLSFDQKLPSRTYLGLAAEMLYSDLNGSVGAFQSPPDVSPTIFWSVPIQLQQDLQYRERTLVATVNQLVGDMLAVGVRYRLSEAQLREEIPELMATAQNGNRQPRQSLESLLHQISFDATFNHTSGVFAQFQALWNVQSNSRDLSTLGGEEFWQMNFLAGYRFAQRRGEIAVGVLNLLDLDYRLHPLTPYTELPRARTVLVRLRLNF